MNRLHPSWLPALLTSMMNNCCMLNFGLTCGVASGHNNNQVPGGLEPSNFNSKVFLLVKNAAKGCLLLFVL